MNNYRRRVRHLEKHRPTFPTYTEAELEDLGYSVWRTNPDNPFPENDATLAQYLALPLEQRQYWRNLGRRFINYAITHPQVVSDILEEIANEWGIEP